jgi:hypothetical protein
MKTIPTFSPTKTMTELFQTEETLSPRLQWMIRHQIGTQHFPNNTPEWVAFHAEDSAAGDTETEAISRLAQLLNLPFWNQ